MNIPTLYEKLQLDNHNLWYKYFNSREPSDVPIGLSEFEKVLVDYTLKPSTALHTLRKSLSMVLGLKSLSLSDLKLQKFLSDTNPSKPTLIISSPDIDPISYLKYIAEKNNNTLLEMSIEEDKFDLCIDQIKNAAKIGNWICLKNSNLYSKLPSLINNITKEIEYADTFRICLIENINTKWNDNLFDGFVKYIMELPTSLKQKIFYFINRFPDIFLSVQESKSMKVRVVIMILHAALIENRLFIPQGWCNWYDFEEADLRITLNAFSSIHAMNPNKIDWVAIRGLCDSLSYGGRIKSKQDQLKLKSILSDFFNPKIFDVEWSPLNFRIPIKNSVLLQVSS